MLKLKLSQAYFEEVETIEEARLIVTNYIESNDLLASTYEDSELFDENGRKLGRFSYNGRFWPEREADK